MSRAIRIYLLLFGVIAGAVLLLFLVAESLNLSLLQDPTPTLRESGWTAPLISIGIMGSDIILPIPSSVLMTANGRLFGAIGGAITSLLGALLAGGIAYALGRLSERWVDRHTTPGDRERTRHFINRYGLFAIILSRPVPIFAETVAVVAGAARMQPGLYAAGIVLGSVPISVLYALAGAYAVDWQAGAISAVIVVVLSGIFFLVGRRLPG